MRTIISALSILILLTGCGGGDSNSASSSSSEDTAVAASTPAPQDQHALRQRAQEYWNPVISGLAFAGESVRLAAADLAQGNSVEAQQYIIEGEKMADRAHNAAMGTSPDGDEWSQIGSDLSTAASSYKDVLQKLSEGIDQGSSLDIAQAVSGMDDVRSSITEATDAARKWYVDHGGRSSDLTDVDEASKAADQLIKALGGSDSSDDTGR